MSGMGKHWASLTCEQQDMHSELSFYMSIISTTGGIALLKISICLNLLRLSTSRWYSISLWCTLGMLKQTGTAELHVTGDFPQGAGADVSKLQVLFVRTNLWEQ